MQYFKLFCIFLTLFFFTTANAETMTGNYDINYYQDNPVERTMIFSNTEATAKSYSLDIVGEKTAWTYTTPTKETVKGFCSSSQDIVLCVAPSDFALAANAKREIYFFSKAKTYAKPGLYLIDAISNATKIGTFNITVQQGHTIELTIDAAEQTTGQCEAKTFTATIFNNGRFTDEASVSVDGLPQEWVSTTEQYFLLASGQKKTVDVRIQAPCSQELKKYSGTINAKIQKADYSTTKSISFTIENKQGLNIADINGTANALSACKEQSIRQQITISNNGRLNDEIELSIKAPDFVKLDNTTLSINAGATKTTNLQINKTDAAEKTYSVELTIKSKKFNVSTTKTININLQNCYDASIAKTAGNEKSCLGKTDTIKFEIKNNKTKTISLKLSTSGLKAKLDKTTVSIEPGKTETVSATTNYVGESAGAKELKLIAQGDYFSTEATAKVELFDCKLDIAPEKTIIDVNVSVGALTKLTVSNNTLTTENINVLVQGKDWILFNPKEFSLNAGDKKDVFMYLSPPYYSEDDKTSISITARSNNYSATKAIDANIFGGTQVGKADVIVGTTTIKEIGTAKILTLTVLLENDSNVSLMVVDVNSDKFEASYSMQNKKIKAKESNPIELTIQLPKGFDKNNFSVPLTIKTDQGDYNRYLVIDLAPAKTTPSDKNASAMPTIGIGMAFFSQPKNMLIVGIIIVLIAIIAFIAIKGKDEKENEETITINEFGEEIKQETEQEEKPKAKKSKKGK